MRGTAVRIIPGARRAAPGRTTALDPVLQAGLAFAVQKLDELRLLRWGLAEGREAIAAELAANREALSGRQRLRTGREDGRRRVERLDANASRRSLPYAARAPLQRAATALPQFLAPALPELRCPLPHAPAGIDPEAVDAVPPHPIGEGGDDVVLDFGVVVVEVLEVVPVEIAGDLAVGAALEPAVVRRARPTTGNVQVVAVPVGNVIGHEVHDHPQPKRLGALHQGVEFGLGAELRAHPERVGERVAEIAFRRGGHGREPDGGHTQRGDLLKSLQHVAKTRRPEEERHHAVDHGTVHPGRMLALQVDLGRLAGGHPEHAGALVDPAERVEDAQGHVVLAIGRRNPQLQLLADQRLLIDGLAAGDGDQGRRVVGPGGPFVADDGRRNALGALGAAGIQVDRAVFDSQPDPGLGGVLQLHGPSLLGLCGARAATAGLYPVDAFLQRYPGFEAAAIAPGRHRTGRRAQLDLVAVAGVDPAADQLVEGPGLAAVGVEGKIGRKQALAAAEQGRKQQEPAIERSHAEARDWRDGRANMMGI
mgnify:CR=1 FL=1